MSEAATAFSALGHPDRFEMIRMLGQAGKTGIGSGELARRMNLPPTTVSSHLKVLRDAELVHRRNFVGMGRKGLYVVADGQLSALGSLLSSLAI